MSSFAIDKAPRHGKTSQADARRVTRPPKAVRWSAVRTLSYEQARQLLSPRVTEDRRLALNDARCMALYSGFIDCTAAASTQRDQLEELAERAIEGAAADGATFIRIADGLLNAAAEHSPEARDLLASALFSVLAREEWAEVRQTVLHHREGWMLLSDVARSLLTLGSATSTQVAEVLGLDAGKDDTLRVLAENWQALRDRHTVGPAPKRLTEASR